MSMIHIVTVNYNQESYLNKIKNVVNSHNYISLTVVDNSKNLIDKTNSNYITHIIPEENIGYLAGLSLGLKKVSIAAKDIVILCNPDIYFNDKFFNDLYKLKDFNKFDLIAPSIIDTTNCNQNPNRTKKCTLIELILYDIEFFNYISFVMVRKMKYFIKISSKVFKKKDTDLKKEPIEIFLPHGSCMIFKGAFFDNYPFFDYSVFLWGEEAIIADSVRKKGGKVIFNSNLVVKHIENSVTKKIPEFQKYKIWKKSYKVYRELLF